MVRTYYEVHMAYNQTDIMDWQTCGQGHKNVIVTTTATY